MVHRLLPIEFTLGIDPQPDGALDHRRQLGSEAPVQEWVRGNFVQQLVIICLYESFLFTKECQSAEKWWSCLVDAGHFSGP